MPTQLWGAEVQQVIQAAQAASLSPNPALRPFPSPIDWRDQWIYFLLVDRFNNPTKPPQPATVAWDTPYLPYRGGNFAGVKDKLKYIKDLGAGAIWLSPVLKNPQWFSDFYGGYGTLDFLNIEPRFCANPLAALNNPKLADQEFRQLVDAAHDAGLYVILDIVLHHCGDVFTYPGRGDSTNWNSGPAGAEYSINWFDQSGQSQSTWTDIANVQNLSPNAGIWPQELQRNDYFRRRGADDHIVESDFYVLKSLVTEYLNTADGSYPVRNILIRAYQYLIARFDLDGYRIDTLKYVEPEFARTFGNAMREFAQSIGKLNFFTFGEVWTDENDGEIVKFIGRDTSTSAELVGVDAALDFPLRHRLNTICKGQQAPADLATFYDARRQYEKTVISSHGDASLYFVTFLDNHDVNNRFYFDDPASPGAWDNQFTMATAVQFALVGVPCLYYGAEQGLHGIGNSREAVREALWGKPNAFKKTHPFYRLIQNLTDARNTEPALRYGRQYFREVSGDNNAFGYSPFPGGVIAFSRILNDREILVLANTNTSQKIDIYVTLDNQLNKAGQKFAILFTNQDDGKAKTPDKATGAAPGRVTAKAHLRPMEVQFLQPV
ncbi:MAG TPA: alpha-amylase family glycosyl hydrolase [Tepidisphaeraceae bacterium]|nr:alpha-amylase family glycosyl hydrolase [Tepidisphaeraceae bacterium]